MRHLRARGIAAIVCGSWLATLATAMVAAGSGGASPWLVLVLGTVLNAGPTRIALSGRSDAAARIMVGTLAAAAPALLVYSLRGNAWQMDAHMLFFVALAGLTMLCDWRPIVVASLLIAVHHAMLDWLAPDLVFYGTGAIGRVLFHALAVVMQCAMLPWLTLRLENLLQSQHTALEEAQAERRRAADALLLAQEADIAAAAERARHLRAEEVSAAAQRSDFAVPCG